MLKILYIMCTACSAIKICATLKIHEKSWPTVKEFDIWNDGINISEGLKYSNSYENKKSGNSLISVSQNKRKEMMRRKSKVFNLFPVPVDGECLSNDGRRTGICLNVYECRLNGGIARGECSMGFGVCCIFLASCDQTISNNITYIVSPNFPSSMPSNFTSCKIKVKIIDSSVSQLRIDFNHFSLGQPNRKTGICEGDVFNVSGGPSGVFSLCGQNSGQHIYYDIDGHYYARQVSTGSISQPAFNANQTKANISNNDGIIEINMSFTNRFLPIRFWEIRIAQITFSQRAPAGCLQYFTEPEGVIRTFNFADNGRHLAKQHYRSCIRQEENMCSIMYQPCDDQSFKIGPTRSATSTQYDIVTTNSSPEFQDLLSTASFSQSPSTVSNVPLDSTTTDATPINSNLADIEGSGEENVQLPVMTSTRPVRGGFDILSFFRSAFSSKRHAKYSRQFFTTCTDRITMPCIIEDFVGVGMGPLPGCEPVHCGNQFCASGTKPCRIESTVTPFYLGVNFGDGVDKGSAEDNIGACIRYSQVQCI